MISSDSAELLRFPEEGIRSGKLAKIPVFGFAERTRFANQHLSCQTPQRGLSEVNLSTPPARRLGLAFGPSSGRGARGSP